MTISPIAIFSSPLKEKFGIPRQAGIVEELRGTVRLLPPFNSPDATRGLEGFDYIWLIWGFDKRSDKLTVRPPRLGGNERLGVFATRSPFRPNALGLSCVRLFKVGDGTLEVGGADLADGTEIFDIKPYVEYSDSRSGVRNGFVDSHKWKTLDVEMPEDVRNALTSCELAAVKGILAQDPRPKYQNDPQRLYGLDWDGRNIRFRVKDGKAFVLSVENS